MTKAKDVGTRFPFINLEKAIGRAEQLYQADQRGRAVAVPTAFAAWSYSDKSSGGHQTVAALKMYGLIDDTGANEDRRVALTPEALTYFADEREDERKKVLKAFALKPKLINAIWQDWGPTPPPDNVARSHLKIDRKLNEQSARSFLSIYKDNLTFADLGKSATATSVEAAPVEIEESASGAGTERVPPAVGDLIQWSPGGVDQFRPPARVRAVSSDAAWVFVDGTETGILMAEVEVVKRNDERAPVAHSTGKPPTLPLVPPEPGMKRDVFSLDEGEVTITFPAALSRDSFDDLVAWLDLVKRKAERAVKPH